MLFCPPLAFGEPNSPGHHEPDPPCDPGTNRPTWPAPAAYPPVCVVCPPCHCDCDEATGAGGTKGCWARSRESSVQRLSTFAFSPWLNISPTMVMPPSIHWPPPPNSGWLNCAIVPLPWISDCIIVITASVLSP